MRFSGSARRKNSLFFFNAALPGGVGGRSAKAAMRRQPPLTIALGNARFRGVKRTLP
jgi:hypothetical protein